MSGSTVIETIKSAKKPHQCSWCGTKILTGEAYKKYRYFDSGDAGTVKMHPECLEAFESQDSWDKEEGFSPGENPRGCTCGHSVNCPKCTAAMPVIDTRTIDMFAA